MGEMLTPPNVTPDTLTERSDPLSKPVTGSLKVTTNAMSSALVGLDVDGTMLTIWGAVLSMKPGTLTPLDHNPLPARSFTLDPPAAVLTANVKLPSPVIPFTLTV